MRLEEKNGSVRSYANDYTGIHIHRMKLTNNDPLLVRV
jgi:hypothetical protein